MKTSPSQFELMVDFMERNGDLSKPTVGPRGKINNAKLWLKLSDRLNQDTTGDSKTTEKWRKVWSDWKNNIKRKAARIHAGATGTGGGPCTTLELSPIEQRVLQIIGIQAAIGIPSVPEIGLNQNLHQQQNIPEEMNNDTDTSVSLLQVVHTNAANFDTNDYSHMRNWQEIETPEVILMPERSKNVMSVPAEVAEPLEPQPGPSGTQRLGAGASATEAPAWSPQRRDVRRPMYSPMRRRVRQAATETQADRVASHFLDSDQEWRNFRIEHDRENRRLRERELDLQERWLEFMTTFVTIGERLFQKILDK